MYTYERQIPEIAETKIQGLKNHYGCNSKKGLDFFEAQKSADVHHRAECEKLLDDLSKEEQIKAKMEILLLKTLHKHKPIQTKMKHGKKQEQKMFIKDMMLVN